MTRMNMDWLAARRRRGRKGSLSGPVGQRFGADPQESVGGDAAEGFVRVDKKRRDFGNSGPGGGSKLAERGGSHIPHRGAGIVKKPDQRRHDPVGLKVNVSQGVGRALAVRGLWMIEVLEENGYCRSCVGAELGNRKSRVGPDGVALVRQADQESGQACGADGPQSLRRHKPRKVVCSGEQLGKCWDGGGGGGAKDVKPVPGSPVDGRILVREHLKEEWDRIGADGSYGLCSAVFIRLVRVVFRVKLEPLGQGSALVGGFSSGCAGRSHEAKGQGEKGDQQTAARLADLHTHGRILPRPFRGLNVQCQPQR